MKILLILALTVFGASSLAQNDSMIERAVRACISEVSETLKNPELKASAGQFKVEMERQLRREISDRELPQVICLVALQAEPEKFLTKFGFRKA